MRRITRRGGAAGAAGRPLWRPPARAAGWLAAAPQGAPPAAPLGHGALARQRRQPRPSQRGSGRSARSGSAPTGKLVLPGGGRRSRSGWRRSGTGGSARRRHGGGARQPTARTRRRRYQR